MRALKIMTITTLGLFVYTAAFASTAGSIRNLPNGTQISLSGTVENFNSAKSFTLRDPSGAVKIDLAHAPSLILKNGDKVNVDGTVDKGIFTTEVDASSVTADKNFGQQVGEAIDNLTGETPASQATAASVKTLPDSGLVKVSGTVDDVSNAKKFTLKDSTGTVDVAIKSGESAALQKGAGVTVVGYVKKGLLGKSINATNVDLQSP